MLFNRKSLKGNKATLSASLRPEEMSANISKSKLFNFKWFGRQTGGGTLRKPLLGALSALLVLALAFPLTSNAHGKAIGKIMAQAELTWPLGREGFSNIPLPDVVFGPNKHDGIREASPTHEALIDALKEIGENSGGLVKVGPIFDHGNPDALMPLEPIEVTGGSISDADIFRAINNSLPDQLKLNDVDNTLFKAMGKSTQGRFIWGARAGTPGKTKVFINGGIHGNEIHATPAILKLLELLTSEDGAFLRANLDMLIIPRTNVDGSNTAEGCIFADDNRVLGPDGEPFSPYKDDNNDGVVNGSGPDCGVHRHNVDPRAGNPDLVGFPTLGPLAHWRNLGFGVNRHSFVLDPRADTGPYTKTVNPILPMDNRLLTYAVEKFAPDYGIDIHAKNPQLNCKGRVDIDRNDPRYVVGAAPFGFTPVTCTNQKDLKKNISLEGTYDSDPSIVNFADEDFGPDNVIEEPDGQARAARILAHVLNDQRDKGFSIGLFAQEAATFAPGTFTLGDAITFAGTHRRAPGAPTAKSFLIEPQGIYVATAAHTASISTGSGGIAHESDRYIDVAFTGLVAWLEGIAMDVVSDVGLEDDLDNFKTANVDTFYLGDNWNVDFPIGWNSFIENVVGLDCADVPVGPPEGQILGFSVFCYPDGFELDDAEFFLSR